VTTAIQPAKVFISYAREDEALRGMLEKQLTILRRHGLIATWHDRRITAGAEWAQQIAGELEAADLILLLVSADFLASDYIHDIELKRALERHNAKAARVVPVIVRPCMWQYSAFAKLQALPRDAEPVISSRWGSLDVAFQDVAEGLVRVIDELAGSPIGSFPVEPDVPNFTRNNLPPANPDFVGRDQIELDPRVWTAG